MAGGYAADHVLRNPNFPDAEGIFVAGRALNDAWMYDGYYWTELPPMSTIRDRPACTLVQLDNGDVNLLVSCNWDRCIFNLYFEFKLIQKCYFFTVFCCWFPVKEWSLTG